MAAASVVQHPNTSPRPTAASPNAVSWAYRWLFGTTVFNRNSLKKPIGLPSAYFVTRIGMTCSQRSDAVGTGRKPQASATLSLVKIALANHTPTAIRRPASQHSGERIAGAVAVLGRTSIRWYPQWVEKAGRRFRPEPPPSQDPNLCYGVTGRHRPPVPHSTDPCRRTASYRYPPRCRPTAESA